MPARRLTTEKQRQAIKASQKYKGKAVNNLNQLEKDELLQLLAKKAGIL